jgi:hypothetical protein
MVDARGSTAIANAAARTMVLPKFLLCSLRMADSGTGRHIHAGLELLAGRPPCHIADRIRHAGRTIGDDEPANGEARRPDRLRDLASGIREINIDPFS